MIPSLRRRLLLRSGAAIALIFALLGVALYICVRAWLIAELDRGLLAEAEALRAAAEFHRDREHENDGAQPGAVSIDFDGGQPAQFGLAPHPHYFELWARGHSVAGSSSLAGRDLPLMTSGSDAPRFAFVQLPSGAAGREVSLPFVVAPRPEEESGHLERVAESPISATLLVARDTSELSRALAGLTALLCAACGVGLLLGLGLIAAAIRRGLLPVDEVAGRIGRVGRSSLSDRLDPASVPRELRPMVERLNEMLARLQSSFDRERAFTADVAHELRTPLAGIETALDVCASRPRQPKEYEHVIGRCLDVTRQMHAMVDSLLMLARADAGTLVVSREAVCLESLIEESWRPFRERATRRGLRITRSSEVSEPIRTDREKLRQVLQNLFDNAVHYADEGGTVCVKTSTEDAAVRLTISNTGSRLSDEEANQATARFWRGDAARSETGRHCGLGLAISRELIVALKGELKVSSTAGGEFRVGIILPSCAQVHADAAAP